MQQLSGLSRQLLFFIRLAKIKLLGSERLPVAQHGIEDGQEFSHTSHEGNLDPTWNVSIPV
jgi:hypothetical protein